MTSDAMRELVARAIFDYRARNWPSDKRWDEAGWLREEDREGYREWADALLAALTEAGALAPAALTGDERSERYIVLEKATLLRWRDIADATATTLSAEIDRELWIAEPREDAAPAADAATGEPS